MKLITISTDDKVLCFVHRLQGEEGVVTDKYTPSGSTDTMYRVKLLSGDSVTVLRHDLQLIVN